MRKNSKTRIEGHKVILVPYRKAHVLKYHGWMQSEELQQLTASQPLTLEEEYEMQQSWLEDENKCTFIVLNSEVYRQTANENESMAGDVNMFFNDSDDEHSAELEIMIAEVACRGRGFGKEALLAMMQYGLAHLGVQRFTAKIGIGNAKSLNMFRKLGFSEVSRSEVFQEVSLELLVTDNVGKQVADMTKHLQFTEECGS